MPKLGESSSKRTATERDDYISAPEKFFELSGRASAN
jgi:hypothetical protein